MRVEPKTERDAQALQYSWLLTAGNYDFEIVEAEDTESKAGNEMAKIMLRIEREDGKEFKVRDYIVGTDAMAYKVRHFAESIGMLKEYDSGDLPASAMRGKTGRVKIGIEPGRDGFLAKNVVNDYLKPGTGAPAVPKEKTAPFEDDDSIPF